MKKIFALFTIIFMGVCFFFASCGESFLDEEAKQNPTPKDTVVVNGDTIVINDTTVIKTPVWVDITVNGDTIMIDSEGDTIWMRPDSLIISIECQDTITVSSDEPWTLQASEINPKTPVFEWETGGITIWGYNHGQVPVKVRAYGKFRNRTLPFQHPEKFRFEQTEYEPTLTDTTSVVDVEYVLGMYTFVQAHRPQVLCTTTGNVPDVPEFQAMLWKAWHVGPATAIYADGQAIVTCPDSLVAYEVMTDATTQNWLRTTTTSKNYFDVTIINSEVENVNLVVGKSLSVSANKAYVADFAITVTRTLKEIVEKNVPYTYNGRSINFVDSLHACGYKLKGGKVISQSEVIIELAHEETGEIVTISVPVTITEKRRIVAIDSTFTHINYVSPASYSNGIITVDANHNAEFTLHYNDGGIEMENVAYKQHISWRVSYDTEMTVEDLSSVLGRHAVVDGKVTVDGYSFVFNFLNVVCDNILFNGKNYKAYAPACSAEIVAITIETNKLIVEIQGDHDGDNSTIYVELPLNVTEIKIIPGKILGGNVSDSYTDQYSARVTWQFIKTTSSSSSKKYQVYSKLEDEINFVNHEEYDNFGYMSESDPFAYWYDQNAEKHLGTFSAIKMDANQESYLILYKDMNLSTVYTLGTAEEKLSNKYRNPNQGVLQKVVKGGKTLWTFDYKVYYRGTED